MRAGAGMIILDAELCPLLSDEITNLPRAPGALSCWGGFTCEMWREEEATGSQAPSAQLSCGFCSQETTSSVCMGCEGMGLHGGSCSQLVQPSQKSHGTQLKSKQGYLLLLFLLFLLLLLLSYVYLDSAVMEFLLYGNSPPHLFPFFPSSFFTQTDYSEINF